MSTRPARRLSSLAVLVVLLSCVSSEVFAQSTRLYLNSGAAFTAGPGDVVEWWQRGAMFEVGAGRKFEPRLELTLTAGSAHLPLDRARLIATGARLAVSGGEMSIQSILLGLRFELEKGTWFRPYLHVGAGLHRIQVADLAIDVLNPEEACPGQPVCVFGFAPADRPDETAFGFRLAAGISYYLTSASWLFAEPTYTIVFADEGSFGLVPFRLGAAYAF